MNTRKNQTGFTLVELLIVIVVISILAAISYVSYTNSQDRAKAAKAKANAATVKSVAEAYYAKNNTYPTAVSHFRSGTITLPSTIEIFRTGSFTSAIGETTVAYKYVGAPTAATGACIYYWDYNPRAAGPTTWDGAPAVGQPGRSEPIYLGDASSANCSASTSTLRGTTPSP